MECGECGVACVCVPPHEVGEWGAGEDVDGGGRPHTHPLTHTHTHTPPDTHLAATTDGWERTGVAVLNKYKYGDKNREINIEKQKTKIEK